MDMRPDYYVTQYDTGKDIPVTIRVAQNRDYKRTQSEHWQTDWFSDFIQQKDLMKYALEVSESHELIGLGAYRDVPEGILIYVEYIESAPNSNPNLSYQKKYVGIGAVLLAYGIQLSIDHGYGGAIFLKAKTAAIRKHYIEEFGAVPFSRADPYLLLIDGDAARALFFHYLKEE
jgi:hypothetical protein